MKKSAHIIQTAVFICFIALFFILILVLPDREFSQQENRYLEQAPSFSFQALFEGDFTSDFETYLSDQFPFRDSWVTLKAACELAVGKKENNGVYYCGDDTLITKFTAPDQTLLTTNINAVNALAENAGVPVYFALIPGAADIWRDKLPANTDFISQKDIIDSCYNNSQAICVDVYSQLNDHRGEDIYYRTDHHWTSLGAYYGYRALMNVMGQGEIKSLEEYDKETVSDSFLGTTYSSSGYSWTAPDKMDIYVRPYDGLEIVNYPEGVAVEGVLYDESYLEKKDKYSFFMGGNTPMMTISTGNEDKPSILILRDSYMDSLTPFLLSEFSSIHILDLRYYRSSITSYIEENDLDSVLVCYSVDNFTTDRNIFLAGK